MSSPGDQRADVPPLASPVRRDEGEEAKWLKHLEGESKRLKHLLAEAELDKTILKKALRGNCWALFAVERRSPMFNVSWACPSVGRAGRLVSFDQVRQYRPLTDEEEKRLVAEMLALVGRRGDRRRDAESPPGQLICLQRTLNVSRFKAAPTSTLSLLDLLILVDWQMAQWKRGT